MKYQVPIITDSNNNIRGFFSLHTSLGPVVIVFSNRTKLGAFADQASKMLEPQGEKVGWFTFESSSVDEVVSQIMKNDHTGGLAGTINFLPDSDPMCNDLLDQLGNQDAQRRC